MEDIEEKMQAEIEAEEQAFKEKEEKEKCPRSSGYVSWQLLMLLCKGKVAVAKKRRRKMSRRRERLKHAGRGLPETCL